VARRGSELITRRKQKRRRKRELLKRL